MSYGLAYEVYDLISIFSYLLAEFTTCVYAPQVIETLKSIPLHEIPDKSLLDSLLAERGIDDPAIRAFAICNAIQDPKTKRLVWQINLDAIHRWEQVFPPLFFPIWGRVTLFFNFYSEDTG